MTATEVLVSQQRIRERTRQMAVMYGSALAPIATRAMCTAMLGFYRPHNRGAKPAARLRHSLTVLAMRQLDSIKF